MARPVVLNEVSRRDVKGNEIQELRGLYCTNCHNALSQALYVADDLTDPATQQGRTLRDRSLAEVIQEVAGGNATAIPDTIHRSGRRSLENDPLITYYRSITARRSGARVGRTTIAAFHSAWN